MGLFSKLFKKKQETISATQEMKTMETVLESIDGISLLEKHKNGLLDDRLFLSSFGKVKVFYSTPMGDHKDGGTRLFILPAQDDKTAYLPVFTSTKRAMDFFESVGRTGFLIMEGDFTSFLETTKIVNAGNTPIKLGAVIDPGYYGVTVGADILNTVIDMTK